MNCCTCDNAPVEIAAANFPQIRQFAVPHKGSLEPFDSVQGNFLYVTMEHMKRLEAEVLELITGLGGDAGMEMHGFRVRPEQFIGLEINKQAVAIAQLVLWIGYFQWQRKTTGKADTGDRPLLPKDQSIFEQDAVLAYDARTPRRDPDSGEILTVWNGHTTKTHPITGKEVPDESACTVLFDYSNPRCAEWPQADYITGNPPFLGASRMREALGDGYTESLRKAWNGSVPESADFVMFWWQKAAELVRDGKVKRFGFITTNSIYQRLFNESVPKLRRMLSGLPRFIGTAETAKHRMFSFLDGQVLPDQMVISIASDDAFHVGVLSSKYHVVWALATGGNLGGVTPRYNKTRCFETFPFPSLEESPLKQRIRDLGERLDAHHKRQQAQHPGLTLTGIYNVLEKLRAGEVLNAKDRETHDQGLISVLKEIHDDLDAAVLEAYGWDKEAPHSCGAGECEAIDPREALPKDVPFTSRQECRDSSPLADILARGGHSAEALEQQILTHLVALI